MILLESLKIHEGLYCLSVLLDSMNTSYRPQYNIFTTARCFAVHFFHFLAEKLLTSDIGKSLVQLARGSSPQHAKNVSSSDPRYE